MRARECSPHDWPSGRAEDVVAAVVIVAMPEELLRGPIPPSAERGASGSRFSGSLPLFLRLLHLALRPARSPHLPFPPFGVPPDRPEFHQ